MQLTSQQLTTLIIFLVCYVYLCFGKKFKPPVVWTAVVLLFLLGMWGGFDAAAVKEAISQINWNVLGTFTGTGIVAALFISTMAPLFLAKLLVDRSPSVGIAIVMVCLLAGFVSAWVDNVATVLIVAPIAFSMAEHLKANPVPFIIGLAVSSNLQGSATLIGDPPSMILAGYSGMTFNDFFWMQGKPGLFFAVQVGALVSAVVLFLVFRKFNAKPSKLPEVKVTSWIPGLLLIGIIATLAGLNIFGIDFPVKNGIVCMSAATLGLLWYYSKKISREGAASIFPHAIAKAKDFDWSTVLLLAGLFVLVGTLTKVGLIEVIAQVIKNITGGNIFLTFLILVWVSVALSAFIDNIPYVTAMVPVVMNLSGAIKGQPLPPTACIWLFGLLLGATIGGNITPIGASANVVATGMLQKRGHKVSFGDFMKIGLPFTVCATLAASFFVWFIWAR